LAGNGEELDAPDWHQDGSGTAVKGTTMKKPTLSIGLPVYNGERYLPKALASLLSQDFEDFELIISDNGSSDQTEAICSEFAGKDARIRYLRSDENHGATWNFRRVFELSEGDFFKYAAYDDECYPTMFRRCMEVFRVSDPNVALVYTLSETIDEKSNVIPPEVVGNWDRVATIARTPQQRLAHIIWRALHGHAHYGVIRSSFLRRARPYGCVAADWMLLAELGMMGKIIEVPEVLFRLRIHRANSWNASSTSLKILQWHNPAANGLETVLPLRIAIILAYLKSVRHATLSPFDKMMCMTVACITPPLRNVWLWFWRATPWVWFLRATGPTRKYLRKLTGWKALCPKAVYDDSRMGERNSEKVLR
jgi:glycosyltransferase involved in cell wall biosynthesis